jgi:hypothetical protein
MAALGSYFGAHTADLKIYMGSFQIGLGNFGEFDDFDVEFTGSYVVLFNSGDLTIGIKLSDKKPTDLSGQR